MAQHAGSSADGIDPEALRQLLEQLDGPQRELVKALAHRADRLADENARLRTAVLKSTRVTGTMSSKLKDALYE
ncbi:hypothetical protein [Paenibacillus koleovorans]|uniref:hypothetical protein n=1 Tax=Paenibacillus koleovorans TaxID=121608 RepID=UPI000FD7F2B9|nr:hypothetical protein [Paenibacillus koleovorans]